MFDSLLQALGFSSKHQSETEAMQATANAFIGVKDIRGSILYTRENKIFAYIKVQGIAMGLLSDVEKRSFIHEITSELSNETKPFRLLAIPRPVDISVVMDEYMDLYAACTHPQQKDLLRKDIGQLAEFATSREVIERQFYIVIWDACREDAERDLLKRAGDWKQKLSGRGVNAEILPQEAIITLCNLFANPSYAHLEDSDYETSMPLLTGMDKE